jgi:hypothetical protein
MAAFQGLGLKCLQEVSERLELLSVPVGQYLYRAGEAAESLFFVCGGSVQLLNNGEPVEVPAPALAHALHPNCQGFALVLDFRAHAFGIVAFRLRPGMQIGSEAKVLPASVHSALSQRGKDFGRTLQER